MCFLYRQSISIVYESKFKYIYRYFIKIDRCFCEILQSLPLRKCGLKSLEKKKFRNTKGHFPCGSVDWNAVKDNAVVMLPRHFPCGSVDWNPAEFWYVKMKYGHFPCGSVDWNRDYDDFYDRCKGSLPLRKCGLKSSSSCLIFPVFRHFPCGSVDWNISCSTAPVRISPSLPLRKCGLKLSGLWWERI